MRRKRHRKNKNKYVVLSAFFLLFLFSVGYSVFSSEFLISGKGTIIEKNFTYVGGVNVKLVTEGSGLYKSEYEEGRYIYRGYSPDNYLTLGSDTYRIISKEADETLKVIKSEKIGEMIFDPGYHTNISGVTSSSSTDGTRYSSNSDDYCYASSASSYDGCNVWGSKTTMLDSIGNNVTTMPGVIGGDEYNLPDSEAYLNTYLNTTWYNSLSSSVQNVITTHLFNVGLVDKEETNIINTLATEQAYKWRGKVGLANVSDQVFATTEENCSSVNDHYGLYKCYTNSSDNWLVLDVMYPNGPWFITPIPRPLDGHSLTESVFNEETGMPFLSQKLVNDSRAVILVLYLKSDINFVGTGTSSDPFVLSA